MLSQRTSRLTVPQHYQVRALNSSGSSSSSNVVSQLSLTLAPGILPASLIQATSFTAHWMPVAGTTNYQLEVSSDYAFTSIIVSLNPGSLVTSALSCSRTKPGNVEIFVQPKSSILSRWTHTHFPCLARKNSVCITGMTINRWYRIS